MKTDIRIDNARKIYPNGFEALKGVNLEVASGDFFGLLGPNGAGKTTLISAMAGLSQLTSGSISVVGYDVKTRPYDVRRNMGVVPQELVYDPFFTVREALRFQSGYFGIRNNDAWIDEILFNLGLLDKADANTRNLSGGMKRRLMVGLALVHRPPVIVLDEPTAGVDVELRQSLWAFISHINQEGHTIILTTHYLEEAQNLCRHIGMMKDGELIALDSTQNLLQAKKGVHIDISLSAISLPEDHAGQVLGQEGRRYQLHFSDYNQLLVFLNSLKQKHITIEHFQVLERDLEDVFMTLMHENGRDTWA